MITFAHISDLHIDGSARQRDRTRAVVEYLTSLRIPVDAVLVTGDLTDSGAAADYATVAELVAPLAERTRVLWCPGNHDDRAGFRAFAGIDRAGPVNQAVQVGQAVVLLCDSLIPGSSEGELSEATLEWLDSSIAAAGGPVFVALHHPPAPLELPALDRIALRNPEDLASVLGRHGNVAGILCGHAHTAAATSFAGLPVRVAPGVKSTALLPFEVGDEYVMSLDHPVMVMFHVYTSRGLTTHHRVVRDLGESAH